MERDSNGRFVKGYKLTEEEKLSRVGKNSYFLGKHHTEEAKLKNSLAHLGKRPSEETRKKLSLSHLGFKHTEESKLKMSLAQIGKEFSEEHKKKLSEARLGYKISDETKHKISEGQKRIGNKPPSHLGKHRSEETKLKMSLTHQGEKNFNWKGGITPEYLKLRNSTESQNWRKEVYERDNYTCQICGDNKGGNLNAHHIKSFLKYPELRFEVSNGITYCENCHETNGFHKGIRLALAVSI